MRTQLNINSEEHYIKAEKIHVRTSNWSKNIVPNLCTAILQKEDIYTLSTQTHIRTQELHASELQS